MEANALTARPFLPLLVKGHLEVEADVRASGRHFDLTDIDEVGLLNARSLLQIATDLLVEGKRRAIEDLAVQLIHAHFDELPEAEDVLVLPLVVDHD